MNVLECAIKTEKIVDIVSKVTACGKAVPDGEEVRLCSPVRMQELAAAISIFSASSLPTKLEYIYIYIYCTSLLQSIFKNSDLGLLLKKKIQSI